MKKRGAFAVIYALFIGLIMLLSIDDYCIFRTTIESDINLLFGLVYLILVYGITFGAFIFLLHKITLASLGLTSFFVILAIPVAFMLDPYVYNRDLFPELFRFFHAEFHLYVSLLYISVLTLLTFPLSVIGYKENIRRKAIENALGKSKTK